MLPRSQREAIEGQPGLFRAALLGLCPECGSGTLFQAPASIASNCGECGLDFAEIERGARFAGMLTVLIAAVLITLALAVEATLRPPLWMQAAFWAPVTVGTVIYSLRLYKTVLLYAAYEPRKGTPE